MAPPKVSGRGQARRGGAQRCASSHGPARPGQRAPPLAGPARPMRAGPLPHQDLPSKCGQAGPHLPRHPEGQMEPGAANPHGAAQVRARGGGWQVAGGSAARQQSSPRLPRTGHQTLAACSPPHRSIQALLSAPNPDDPLADAVAQHWKSDEPAAIRTGKGCKRAPRGRGQCASLGPLAGWQTRAWPGCTLEGAPPARMGTRPARACLLPCSARVDAQVRAELSWAGGLCARRTSTQRVAAAMWPHKSSAWAAGRLVCAA